MKIKDRISDSPLIDSVWFGQVDKSFFSYCPADSSLCLLLHKEEEVVKISVAGPATKTSKHFYNQGVELLQIKFKRGVFISNLHARILVDNEIILPNVRSNSFWLDNAVWEFPHFDDIEILINRLVKENLLRYDPVVKAALEDNIRIFPPRTVRYHFQKATGLTQGYIRQIERAQYATTLLKKGTPIIDVVYLVGYTDQPHMTRSLKYFIGMTPGQLLSEQCSYIAV